MVRRISIALLLIVLVAALLLSACSSKPQQAEELAFWAAPAACVPILVAEREGYFDELGLNIDPRPSIDNMTPFLAGKTPFVISSSWEVAGQRIKGEDMMVAGTSAQTRFFNGIAIRKADVGKYKEAKDLVGHKLGNPGLSSGTWIAFRGLAKAAWGIDADKDFQNATASPGALLGLLDKGEIDGALLFGGQTLAAENSGFPLIFSFDQAWMQKTGQPLLIGTLVARGPWLRANVSTVIKINQGLDKAALWMSQNPDQFDIGGRYETNARDAGWLANKETTAAVKKYLQEWRYFTQGTLYTDTWIAAHYEFDKLVNGPQTPPSTDIYFPPAQLKAK